MILAFILNVFIYASEPLMCTVNSGPLKGQDITLAIQKNQVTLYDKTNTRLLCQRSVDSKTQAIDLVCGEGFFQSKIHILPDGLGTITTMNIESKLNCQKSVYSALKTEIQTKELNR